VPTRQQERQQPRSRSAALWKWGGAAAVGAAAAGIVLSRQAASRPRANAADTKRPSWAKLLAEAPAALRLSAAQFLPAPVREPSLGHGRPVLVIPGLLAHDAVTLRLRRTLSACGFRPYGWREGFNLGVREDLFGRLGARLDEIIDEAGGPVALVGWSLGGLYARELAKRRPDDVSMVVTMGSPFSVDLRDNNAWKLYEAINDHPVDRPPVPVNVDEKPPVPTFAMWSEADGIVAPASASGKPWEYDERIELHCRHNELVSHPEALRALIGVLGRDR
jgi:hypothetical protein